MTYGTLPTMETNQPAQPVMTATTTTTTSKATAKRKRPKAGRVLLFLLVVGVAAPVWMLVKTVSKTVKTVSQNGSETVSETVSYPQETEEKTVSTYEAGQTLLDADGNELVVQRKGGRPKKKSEKPAAES